MIRHFILLYILISNISLPAQQSGIFIIEETSYFSILDHSEYKDTTNTYLTEDCIRRDENGKYQTTIIRSDIQKIWMIHHKNRTYNELTSEMFQGLGVMGVMMYGVMIDTVTGLPVIPEPLFKKTGQTRKIGEWNCFKLILNKKKEEGFVSGILDSMTLWVSADTGLDGKTYGIILRRMMGDLGPLYESFFSQLDNMGGYPIMIESEIVGQKVIQKLISYARCEINESIFKLPKGYKREEAF